MNIYFISTYTVHSYINIKYMLNKKKNRTANGIINRHKHKNVYKTLPKKASQTNTTISFIKLDLIEAFCSILNPHCVSYPSK